MAGGTSASDPEFRIPSPLQQHQLPGALAPDAFAETAASLIAAGNAAAPVALLVADVDHFRRVVDLHGEGAAQALMGELCELVGRNLRTGDLLARAAGDEVLVLLRSGLSEAVDAAQRLCAAVRGHAFRIEGAEQPARVTMSVGVAGAPENGSTYAALHTAADGARVWLKAHGRDGAAAAPVGATEPPHRPLEIDRFVGRREELATLRGWLDEAVRGQPRVVAVLGDAGIGTAALVRQLEPDVRLLGGAFAEGRAAPGPMRDAYGVWISALESLRRMPNAPQREWQELPKLLPSLGAANQRDNDRPGSKYLLHEELVEHLRAAAEQQPIVLFLDEMQWADEESWDALEYVVQQLDTERLLICVTMRTEPAFYEAAERRRALASNDIFHEVSLTRLTRDDVKRWLEAAFHHQDVGREFLAFLYRHTEGNPLFISELLRTLLDEGALWHNGERWEWRPVSELRLPPGLSALIARRLSRFPSTTLAVLSIAAIVGHEFDVALVVAAGAGSDRAVQLALAEALVGGIIHRTFDRAGGRFAFSHHVFSEALVEVVPADQLRQLHARVAAALERLASDRLADIAWHYDQAEAHPAAYAKSLEAAARAERITAHAAATRFLRAAERNATSPAELAEVRVRLANLAEAAGRYDEVEELCDLAVEWFDAQGDRRRALVLRRIRERARRELGQPALVTLDALQKLDSEAEVLGFDRERVAIMMMLSQTYGRVGDPESEVRIAEQCVKMAEPLGEPALLAEALQRLARSVQANVSSGDSLARARAIYHHALELFRETGDVRGQASILNNLGIVAMNEALWAEAREALSSAIALARSIGAPDLWGHAATNLALMTQRIGDYDEARELFGEALAKFAAIKNSHGQVIAVYNMADVERESGAINTAVELYEATISLAKRIGANEIEIGATAAAALCYLESGRIEEARSAAAEVEERMRARTGWFQGRDVVEALRVRMSLLDGDLDTAVSLFEKAMPLADASDLYTAAWLTAACATQLFDARPEMVKKWIRKYADRLEALGYAHMSRRYMDLLAR